MVFNIHARLKTLALTMPFTSPLIAPSHQILQWLASVPSSSYCLETPCNCFLEVGAVVCVYVLESHPGGVTFV